MSGKLRVDRAAGALGAYVHGVSIAAAVEDAQLLHSLRALVVEHEVLFLRDQHVEAPILEAFARGFGPVLDHPAYALAPGTTGVQVLESTPENPSKIEVWHSDMTFSATPPPFTMLLARTVPPAGGDTLWASARAACEALSSSMKGFLAGLTATHDFRHGFAESLAEPGGPERLAGAIAANPPVSHPVVRRHPERGTDALYVNALFTTVIDGLGAHESAGMLDWLCRHIVTDEFTVRLAWEPGTLAIWDNRSTQHKPVNDFHPAVRRMHRVTVSG